MILRYISEHYSPGGNSDGKSSMSLCLVLRSSIALSGSLISAEISRVSFSILALSTSGESTDTVPSRASSENKFESRESRVPQL